jgi:hypothetical protein
MVRSRVNLTVDTNKKQAKTSSSVNVSGDGFGVYSEHSSGVGVYGIEQSHAQGWSLGGVGHQSNDAFSISGHGVQATQGEHWSVFGVGGGYQESTTLNGDGFSTQYHADFAGHEYGYNVHIPAPSMPHTNVTSSFRDRLQGMTHSVSENMPSMQQLLEQAQRACVGVQDGCRSLISDIQHMTPPSDWHVSLDLSVISSSATNLFHRAGDALSSLNALDLSDVHVGADISSICSGLLEHVNGFMSSVAHLGSFIDLGAVGSGLLECGAVLVEVVKFIGDIGGAVFDFIGELN